MPTVAESFTKAWQTQQQGQLAQAEQMYRQILQVDPSHVDAMCLLAAVCQAQGNVLDAETHYRRVLQLWPNNALAHNGLGILLAQQNKLQESVAMFERLLRIAPKDADAYNNLGLVLVSLGRREEAIAHYRQALELRPDSGSARQNLQNVLGEEHVEPPRPAPVTAVHQVGGEAAMAVQLALQRSGYLAQQGQHQQARLELEQALVWQPDNVDLLTQLGHAFVRLENYGEAMARYRQALRIRPDNFEAQYILGIALHERGELAEAVEHYRQAVFLRPQFADAFNNLASALLHLGKLDESMACCKAAIEIRPEFAEAFSNLGCVYLKKARWDQAIESLRQSLRLRPEMPSPRSNLLFCMNYDPEITPDAVFAEHCEWGRLHGPTSPAALHVNDRSPERRLRIGYVSPDYRAHALVRYFEPVLVNHDPEQVEVFCYAEVAVADDTTRRIEKLAHHWCSTCKLNDAQLAQRIRDDRIDILVDLAGHTAGNRLLTFALKPAPIQATWLGYINTTGLATVDYRFSDEVLDPLGFPVRDTETLFRLPSGFCCFGAPDDAPAVPTPPVQTRGHITFGSLNNSFKFNHRVYDLWSRVLRALPTSRLLMFRDSLTTSAREQLRTEFAQRGIESQRLDLRQWSGAPGFLEVYNEIDICLDTFPFTGGVTTCEALWMGVPVVSLAGMRPMGRHSASLLARVGLGDWAVETPDLYVERAVRAANEVDELAKIRAVLRDRMTATVCNAQRLTSELEDAYRTMWRQWCLAPTSGVLRPGPAAARS